ncbi:MAG TPA: ATP-binding protein [Chitinophagaceae bacterium]|nr:ATP-binding protein [Chitinophagaceae bacterium]
MKIRTKYILFVSLLHLVALVSSYLIFRENKVFFLASELVIIISLVISWKLFNELIQPLQLITRGTEAIKERDFNIRLVPTGKYELDQLIDVYNQMMDALRNERTKQEMQYQFLEKLIHTSPTGILILDYDDNIQQANPKALELLDEDEKAVIGKSIHTLSHPVIQQIRQLQSRHSKTFTFNGAITYKLQKSHFVDRGFPRHFVMIEELTSEILAAEKKTYGKVIRMMAHEVNNTIGPVNSILQSTLPSQIHNDALTNAIQVAIERNNNLNMFMRNLADLVRLPVPVKKQVDLDLLLHNIVELMQLRAGEKLITFRFDAGNDALQVMADHQQMEQVLINVIKNAIEAIDHEGVITIATKSRPPQLIIRDTGKGISPEFEEHLFSAFHSTKKDGQGIGLTVIKEILFNHGFEFSLKTVRQGVTEFTINF